MKRLLWTLLLLFSLLPLNAQKWKPLYEPFDSIMSKCENSRRRGTIGREYRGWIGEMKDMARKNNDRRLEWRTLYWDANYYFRLEEYDKASEIIDKALSKVDSTRYEYDYRRMLLIKDFCCYNNDKPQLYRMAIRALRYFEEVDDSLMMGEACYAIALIYLRIKSPQKALEWKDKAERYYREAGFDEINLFHLPNSMWMNVAAGDSVTARVLYRKALATESFVNDTCPLISLYLNAYAFKFDPGKVKEAYRLCRELGRNQSLYSIACINMGSLYLEDNNPTEALKYYREAEEATRSGSFLNVNDYRLTSLCGIFLCHERLCQWDSAYIYSKAYLDLRETVDNVNSSGKFNEQYEREAIAHEEESLKAERNRAWTRLVSVAGVFMLLLLVALGMIAYYRNRRRLKEAEAQLYKARVESHERDLTASSLLLVEKRNMIDSLSKQITDSAEEGLIDASTGRALQNQIRIHQGNEEGMKKFFEYFNSVHPGFFDTLRAEYPTLTKGDLRLCAYIRMGLDTKQIASIMAIQPEGVKQARYRLRKKLGLKTSDTLDAFLAHYRIK